MSTPQDPRNPGEPPRDSGETPHPHDQPPQSHGGPAPQRGEPPVDRDPETGAPRPGEQVSSSRPPETPDEPAVTPSAPQSPDHTQPPGHSPQPPDRPDAAAAPAQSGDQPGSAGESGTEADPRGGGATPRSSDDPPTEYLPKILHRESSRTGAETGPESPAPGASSPADDNPTRMLPGQSGYPGEPGSEAPPVDKGTAAYTHGWQPGSPEQQPGHRPMGEVPPQAWSAQPEEREPGQAWQPQSPGQPGYPQAGGTPYPPPGAYGSRPDQPGDRSGWGPPPGEQPGQGADRPGQQGWSGGQPGWGAHQPGQQPWGQEQPGQQGWGTDQPGQQPWGQEQPGQPGWGGQQGWGSGQPGGYPAYPQQQYQPYGATQEPERSGPQVLSIIGFVCAAVSLLFCPLVFGLAGIALGVIGHIRGESLGKWAAIAAGVCLIIGMVLALALSGMDVVPIESAG